jgi:hypothetical protein
MEPYGPVKAYNGIALPLLKIFTSSSFESEHCILLCTSILVVITGFSEDLPVACLTISER